MPNGYAVFLPFGHSPDCDLVVRASGRFEAVQVKTSTCRYGNNYKVQLCTRGGNQSWSGTTRFFSSARCDWLFALVADGRRWFVPTTVIAATSAVVLGGSKYAEFEVQRGTPLPTGSLDSRAAAG